MSDLLQVEHLSAGYGEAVVLQDVSFSLAEGETLALLGRNGTGKTTLMDTLAGATRQHGGQHPTGRRDAEPAGIARTRGCGHRLGAAGAQHLQVAHGA
jgi:branched-chain amino acid transport system ATP-binding protein